MNPELKTKIERLQNALGELRSDGDRRFAASLCQQFWTKRGNISPKQIEWVHKLLDRASMPAEPQAIPGAPIGNPAGIFALLQRAATRLQRAAIVLLIDREVVSQDQMIRITLAGPNSRLPGCIFVTSYLAEAGNRRKYYGHLNAQGMFAPRAGMDPEVIRKTVETLKMFALDPVGVAHEHGRLTGKCCFCRIGLDDPRSTARGYGPICARNWGLPWGDRPGEFAAEAC